MSLRIFSAALFLVVAGCGKIVRDKDETPVSCALNSQSAFTDDCWTLPTGRGDGWTMTIHHPDGGFRRLAVDSKGVISAADGASATVVRPLPGGGTEHVIDGDRYRLPARP